MDDKSNGSRPSIPTWVWILAIFAIILGLQLWLSGRFSGPEQISLPDAMDMIKSGQVETITVTGSKLTLTLEDGSEVGTSFDSRTSPEELLTYFGITEEVLAENEVEWINNDQSAWNTLLTIVLSLGPVLLIIWIFTLWLQCRRGPLPTCRKRRADELSSSGRSLIYLYGIDAGAFRNCRKAI